MGFLPDFTLSSNPEITVRLREATVEDAIDFSELDPAFEEEATTVFLDRMQAPEKYTDPRCWTAQDRRHALFMYRLHTEEYDSMPMAYFCTACQKEHAVSVKYADILAEYTPLEGKPFRDVIHEGHAVLVHPLLGRDIETLEKQRLIIDESSSPKEQRRAKANLALNRILFCIDIPHLKEGASEIERRESIKRYVLVYAAWPPYRLQGRKSNAANPQDLLPGRKIAGRCLPPLPLSAFQLHSPHIAAKVGILSLKTCVYMTARI